MKPLVEYDPTTYYASSHTASYNQGDCQFEEPSTYQTGVSASWIPGWPIWGYTGYPLVDPSGSVGNPECGFVWDSTENGTVTPVLTWTPDSATDTEPMPLSVTVQESGQAIAFQDYTFGQNEPGNPLAASDGLGDPAVAVNDGRQPNYVVSEGARMLTADTGGKATVTLPPVALSASGGAGGWSSDNAGEYISPTWVSLSVLVSDPIDASSTAGTVDPHHPQWFSGTACTVQASANPAYFTYNGQTRYNKSVTAPPAYLRSATVRINGQIVRSYPEDYRASSTDTGASLNVMFDSTHFSNGTPIKIEVECHDSLGRSYTTHLTAPAYNQALVLGNQTFGDDAQNSVLAVESAASGVNYDVTHSFQGSGMFAVVGPR